LIVDTASRLEYFSAGGLGKGSSVNVKRAQGLKRGGSRESDHIVGHRYLGRLTSGSWFAAVLPFVSSLPTLVTHVLPSTVLFLLATSSFVPLVARLRLLPVLTPVALSSSISFRGRRSAG
jgi:hypothetical protein